MRGFAVEIARSPILRCAPLKSSTRAAGLRRSPETSTTSATLPAAARDVGAEAAPDAVRGRAAAATASTPVSYPLLHAEARAIAYRGVGCRRWPPGSRRCGSPPPVTVPTSPATSAPPTPVVSPSTTQSSTVAPLEKPEAVPASSRPAISLALHHDAGVPVGARAALTCTRNVDPGGPEGAICFRQGHACRTTSIKWCLHPSPSLSGPDHESGPGGITRHRRSPREPCSAAPAKRSRHPPGPTTLNSSWPWCAPRGNPAWSRCSPGGLATAKGVRQPVSRHQPDAEGATDARQPDMVRGDDARLASSPSPTKQSRTTSTSTTGSPAIAL